VGPARDHRIIKLWEIIMLIVTELYYLLLLMRRLLFFLIFRHIIWDTFINTWQSRHKRNIRVLGRVLLLRGRIEGIHVKSR
jgi:hypothetical protein